MITAKQVVDVLRSVMHPEINERNLVELKMIRDVSIEDKRVTLTPVLPFKQVPIRDDLVSSVREAVTTLDTSLKIEVTLADRSAAIGAIAPRS